MEQTPYPVGDIAPDPFFVSLGLNKVKNLPRFGEAMKAIRTRK